MKILGFSDNMRWSEDKFTTLRQSYEHLNIVNITKCINVNIETSIFTLSREIIGKYVMLCN